MFCFGLFAFCHIEFEWKTPTDVAGIKQRWNSVPPDVDCVTYVLPAAVWKDFKYVSSAAMFILVMLLATPFSANSTQSYQPYVFF